MARLSAHGTERFRLVKSTPTPHSNVTTEERTTVSIRSDGAILSKWDVRMKPDEFSHPDGYWHSYGWKKSVGTTEARKRHLTAETARDAYLNSGYTLVTGT